MTSLFIKRDEQVFGPFTSDQLKAGATKGQLTSNDHVGQSNEGPWIEAHKIPLLNFPKPPDLSPLPPVEAVTELESASEYQLQEEQLPDDTIVLHRLLRDSSEHEACLFDDGETYYFHREGECAVYETHEDHDGIITHRLTVTAMTGYTLEDVQEFLVPADFLFHNFSTEGHASWSINDTRQLVVKHSLCVNRFQDPDNFSEDDLTWLTLQLMHGQIAVTSRRALLFEQIREHLTEQEQADRQEQHSDTAGAIGQLLGGIAKGLLGA